MLNKEKIKDIVNHCNIALKHIEERGMKYNSIWDQVIAIKDDCNEII